MQTIKAPTRAAAGLARTMLPIEVERLAWQLRTKPAHMASFPSISETTGKERWIDRAEAEYILKVRGIAA